jgi:N-acetylmuramoyl-L-alanine amidase
MKKNSPHPNLSSRKSLRSVFLLLPFLFFLTALFSLPSTPGHAAAGSPTAEKRYRIAKAYIHNLEMPNQPFIREEWLVGINMFRTLLREYPNDSAAPSSLYMLGRVYMEMFSRSKNALDLGEAITYFEDIFLMYPQDRLADDALYALGRVYLVDRKDPDRAASTFARVIAVYPDGDMAPEAARELQELKTVKTVPPEQPGQHASNPQEPQLIATGPSPEETWLQNLQDPNCRSAELMPIRHWSSDQYTRVVIETSAPVKYNTYLLERDGDRPRRLFVDLKNCRIISNLNSSIPIDDGLLERVRSAQFSPDTVRVVLDTESTILEHKIFSLDNPFRIVIDVMSAVAQTAQQHQPEPMITRELPRGTPSLVAQLGLGVRRIILDPGHGGKDPGTTSADGLFEKDITLKVAKIMGKKLQELGYTVILTRDRDVFVPLEERTAIANSREGDLFLSIHVNAAPASSAHGIETYVLDLATDSNAMRVAALENATSTRQVSDLQSILMNLMQNTKINESLKLAGHVQDKMVTGLSRSYKDIKNLGIKKAPFVVLIGARMPSILTEIAFISNPREAKRLRDDLYLATVAEHIADGVTGYVNSLSLAKNIP